MKMTAWIEVSAANCGVTAHQLRLWLYRGLISMPRREVLGPRVMRVLDEPLTQLPEQITLTPNNRLCKPQ